jgi:hypothetical protein
MLVSRLDFFFKNINPMPINGVKSSHDMSTSDADWAILSLHSGVFKVPKENK